MVTIEKIQDEILSLSREEKLQLARWFADLEAETWDREIENDFKQGGPGKEILDRVKSDYAAGNCVKWD